MTKIIAIANHKGGVGKTSTTANVGSILASKGKRVLLVDLDAQANLTDTFLEDVSGRTIYNALVDEEEQLPDGENILPIIHVKDNLDVVPSSVSMVKVEPQLYNTMDREYKLRDLLEPVANKYDYILLDCPPSLGIVVINALVCATDLYIVLTPEYLPSIGLNMILNVLRQVKKRANKTLELSGVIIARYERGNTADAIITQLRETFGDIVFNTKIRKNVAISNAPTLRKDVVSYDPRSNGAKDYEALTQEILSR